MKHNILKVYMIVLLSSSNVFIALTLNHDKREQLGPKLLDMKTIICGNIENKLL